ncbi:hypothetical protein [Rhodobacteraceae bacterium DSL-40]|uniref:hypothetical protein n=1 Tax=Amaricoccus sp. B4 TaxID=3368557 RepID=UPI000DAD9C42
MISDARCWDRPLAALTLATSLLSGGATGALMAAGRGRSAGRRAQPALQGVGGGSAGLLPQNAAIVEMLADHAVTRAPRRNTLSSR